MTARRQKLEAQRNPMKVTNYILACQNEGFSRMEFNRTWLDLAQTVGVLVILQLGFVYAPFMQL